jgi:hypothetical protein
MTSRTAQADQWARQTRPKVRRMLHDLAHERVTTEHGRVIRPHNQHDRGSEYGSHRRAGKSGRRHADRSRIAVRVYNPAIQTALGPMVIVAVDQNENPPLIQDALAYQMLPPRGKVAVIAAKWRPLRRLLIGATERRSPDVGEHAVPHALHRREAAGRRLADRCRGDSGGRLRHAGLPTARPGRNAGLRKSISRPTSTASGRD